MKLKFIKFILWLIADDKRITRLSKMLWLIILSLLVMILFSCSPIQRLNNLQEKHPYLFTAKTDTIIHRDTIQVIVPGTSIDTFIHHTKLFDTIVITKNNITTSVWQKGDTVYVNTNADTIWMNVPFEVKVPYTKYVTPPPKKKTFLEYVEIAISLCMWIIVIVACIYIIYRWRTL